MCLGCSVVFQLETSQTNKAAHLLEPDFAISACIYNAIQSMSHDVVSFRVC